MKPTRIGHWLRIAAGCGLPLFLHQDARAQGIYTLDWSAIEGGGGESGGGNFTVSGMANATGSIVMNGAGQAGASQFTGVIDPNSGSMVGTWRLNKQQGNFNGRKQ